MKKPGKDGDGSAAAGEMRDQEVLRATGELAAYFKGLRTEREARAALKIIKAFIKDRERSDAARRRPLPGLEPVAVPRRAAAPKRRKAEAAERKLRRRLHDVVAPPPADDQDNQETTRVLAEGESMERD